MRAWRSSRERHGNGERRVRYGGLVVSALTVGCMAGGLLVAPSVAAEALADRPPAARSDRAAPPSARTEATARTEAAPQGTTTELAAEPDQVAPGQAVALTATVTCPAGVPGGVVTFWLDKVELGVAELTPVDVDAIATHTTSGLSEGEHQVVARYEGDGSCSSSTSAPLTLPVTTADPGRLGVDLNVDKLTARVGGRVAYRIRIMNTGRTTLTNARVVDDLSNVLARSQMRVSPEATIGEVQQEGNALVWTGTLLPGEMSVVTFAVSPFKRGILENKAVWDGGQDLTSTRIVRKAKPRRR